MFSLPRDIPADFDDKAAGWVVRECYTCRNPRLTKSQMEAVRAMLSYAYQLKTGLKSTPKFKANFPSVKDQFGCQNEYAAPTKSLRAKHSMEPSGLKIAWTTEYVPNEELVFPEWNVGGLVGYHWAVNGCRGGPKGGLKRLKTSREHKLIPSQGLLTSAFKGGRPKVPGFNKERAWTGVCVCLCPGAKHKFPPEDWVDNTDKDWNPCYPGNAIPWTTTCPLNMFKCIQDLLAHDQKNRIYPKWLRKQHRFGARDLGKAQLVALAKQWYNLQGGNPDGLELCTNSGRKSCGKWCAELSIPYSESFPVHGDLWSTWSTYYQPSLVREPGYQERDQPRDLEECSRALWKLARFFGRGRENRDDPSEFSQSQIGKLLAATLRSLGQSDMVAHILNST